MNLEELQQQLEGLQARTSTLEAENESLKRAKSGVLKDLAKFKEQNRILRAAGIAVDADDAEDQLTEMLTKRKQAEQVNQPPSNEAVPPKPAGGDTPPATAPTDAANAAMQASIASLQKEVTGLRDKLVESDNKVLKEKRARREDRADRVILSVMEEVGVKDKQRQHLLKLLKLERSFHIAEDETLSDDADPIVLFGTEDSPKTLKDGLTELATFDQWSDFYVNTTPSGSGLPTSRSTGVNTLTSASTNPFVSPGNSTEAARMYESDPKNATRLYNQAKSAGKLDPHCAKIINS
jgi:hypothetical protein